MFCIIQIKHPFQVSTVTLRLWDTSFSEILPLFQISGPSGVLGHPLHFHSFLFLPAVCFHQCLQGDNVVNALPFRVSLLLHRGEGEEGSRSGFLSLLRCLLFSLLWLQNKNFISILARDFVSALQEENLKEYAHSPYIQGSSHLLTILAEFFPEPGCVCLR